MTRVKTSDLEALLAFLGEAGSVEGPNPFPLQLLSLLRRLVPCDDIAYCELDRLRKVEIWSERVPVVEADDGSEIELYWRLRDQHPVCHYHDVSRSFTARKLSDFVTRTELHGSQIYGEYFRPWGVEHQMSVGLDAPLTHTKVFILARSGSRDFTERDRNVLNMLRPHLARMYERAQVCRAARQALALVDRTGEALVVLEGLDRIAHATPEAQRLLAAHFRPSGSVLPAEIAEWLRGARRTASAAPLTAEGDDETLAIHLVDGTLFLETRREASRLTHRESEIVALLAAGKTNSEIARMLWIAPGTVRKHLENVYEKLGVHSRTAAVAVARSG